MAGENIAETHETAAPPREERKIVTALFADLVGSTALGEKLDPEEVKLIVGEAVARIVTAVVQPEVKGWWEFAKTSAPYGDLTVG